MYVIRRRLILSYPVQLVIPKFVPNFKILAVAISEKFVTEVKLERKKKWMNKENDKQEEANTLT